MNNSSRHRTRDTVRPIVLACDTSNQVGSVALVEGGEITAENLMMSARNHSQRLVEDIQSLLTQRGLGIKDVDMLAVTKGPGAFTGIRIGMATMKGLAMATGKPLVGIHSLHALARPMLDREAPVLAALDARKAEVYGLFVDNDGETIIDAKTVSAAELAHEVSEKYPEGPVIGVGEGITAYLEVFGEILGERLITADPWENNIRASVVAFMAMDELGAPPSVEALEPVYLRRPEAEVKRS